MSQDGARVRVSIVLCAIAWIVFSMVTSPVENMPEARAREPIFPLDPETTEPEASKKSKASSAEQTPEVAYPIPDEMRAVTLANQTREQAAAKSQGCLHCHHNAHDPHAQPNRKTALQLGCIDCHGGNPDTIDKHQAHIAPRYPNVWHNSANPVRGYTVLNYERPEFIRFVNPGDLRIAHLSCGMSGCHPRETLEVRKSMMTHGCMLWGSALYNNGAVPGKWPRYGESYSMHGTPQRLQTVPPPTPEETATKGVVPYLDPLPRFQVTHPSNVLRIFERGGKFAPEVGIPERLEEPGRPRQRVSNRGLGTLNRTDPVFIGLQKTRLFDPTLNFMGTNDRAGDYRSSGCTACHMVYANDRSEIHSGPWAKYGKKGRAAATPDELVWHVDPTIPKDESGHPIEHRFITGMPTSQCIVCHIHPGTTVMNSYLGYMWWDLETDGASMYPKEERDLTSEEYTQAQISDPNEIGARGLWSDPEFLDHVSDLNPSLQHSHFADFNGHGWVFKAVFKKDRFGNHLDKFGNILQTPSAADRQRAVDLPLLERELHRNRDQKSLDQILALEKQLQEQRVGTPVHLMDIHLEKGMHCVDCHFVQDVHGNTKLYGEVRAAIEIRCEDCHGTIDARAVKNGIAKLRTSGPAAEERTAPAENGRDLTTMLTPFGKRRFEVRGDRIIQNSMVEPDMHWEIKQVADTIDPGHKDYNAKAALAKTIRFDDVGEMVWGNTPDNSQKCAHSNQRVSCIACHSAWNPSCYGCHLPQKANKKMPDLHNEGDITRNYVSYNFQTLREDVYMLAHDGNVTGNKIGPARSSCAIHVTSYNQNREAIYNQQQTVSSEGLSGISFSSNVPHTVRGMGETKNCTDCHLSDQQDNNAQMAQLLMQGTNFMNFIGRYCWVGAGDHGLFGVVVTERDEPQTVIGSSMHRIVYPDRFEEHCEADYELAHAHEHPGTDIGDKLFHPFKKGEIKSLLARGEFLYAACGELGVRIFDIAFIDHKGFSERITTAPFSPLGTQFYVRTKNATCVAAPTTIAPDPTRKHRPENDEQSVHPIYGYIFATDYEEGLIAIAAGVSLDGNPTNNFIKADVVFNPNGLLHGAKSVTIVGTYVYVCCDAGLVVVSLDNPKSPCVVSVIGSEFLNKPRDVQVQFRYAFVCDEDGLKVLDVTQLSTPVPVAHLPLQDAQKVYVVRNYAYVAGGHEGLVIVDVTQPSAPRLAMKFDAGGKMNDVHDVKLGIYYASLFAFVADGHHGLRVLQLTSQNSPGFDSFLPQPVPQLIATYPIPHGGAAYAISEGVDRDRAVDESGNQIAVFGRVGARPLSLEEQQRLYLRPDRLTPYYVIDGQRDFSLVPAQQREAKLHLDLEAFYGRSRHPLRRKSSP